MIKTATLIVALLLPVLCVAQPVQFIEFKPIIIDGQQYQKTQTKPVKNQKTKFGLYNVGYGKLISINSLVRKIIKLSGKKLKIINDLSKKSLKNSVFLNCTKALREIKWKKKVSLDQGIKKTLKWYLKNYQI